MFLRKKKKEIAPVFVPKTDDAVALIQKERAEKYERESLMHQKKLAEICNGYSEEEAIIICKVFAQRFPDIMHKALSVEHQNMVTMIEHVHKLNQKYEERNEL